MLRRPQTSASCRATATPAVSGVAVSPARSRPPTFVATCRSCTVLCVCYDASLTGQRRPTIRRCYNAVVVGAISLLTKTGFGAICSASSYTISRTYQPNRIRGGCPEQTKGSCGLCKRRHLFIIQTINEGQMLSVRERESTDNPQRRC